MNFFLKKFLLVCKKKKKKIKNFPLSIHNHSFFYFCSIINHWIYPYQINPKVHAVGDWGFLSFFYPGLQTDPETGIFHNSYKHHNSLAPKHSLTKKAPSFFLYILSLSLSLKPSLCSQTKFLDSVNGFYQGGSSSSFSGTYICICIYIYIYIYMHLCLFVFVCVQICKPNISCLKY